jgi:hypothetical protein
MAKSLITPTGMLCFPTLFEPRSAVPGQEPRYNLILLFDEAAQKSAEFKELQNEIMAAATEKFGPKLPSNLRMPIRKAEEKEDYAGFEPGKVFVAPWSKQRPGLVGPSNEEIHVADDVWAGQLARAYIRPFGYDTSGNKGVGLMLEHVQIVKKNMPRIDGRKAATAVFGAVADDSDEI